MNKYQEALDRIKSQRVKVNSWEYRAFADKNSDLDTLQELVDKATPKKPTNQYPIDLGLGNYGDCRICNYGVNYQQNYCDNCGQKIDWGN